MKPKRKTPTDNTNHPEVGKPAPHAPTPRPCTVSARVLYNYLVAPGMDYETWISDHIATFKARRMQYKKYIFRRADIQELELELEVSFALGLALNRSGLFAGAAALILIVENCFSPDPEHPRKADAALRRYEPLVADAKWTCARTLHDFLEIAGDYDLWIKELLRSRNLKAKRDYIRVQRPGSKTSRSLGLRASPREEVFLYYPRVEGIALDAGTFRSDCLRRAIASFKAAARGVNVDTLALFTSFLRPGGTSGPSEPLI